MSGAESALSIEQSGMAIMERIQRARERRSKITSEEMKAVIEERDNAITRVGISIAVNTDHASVWVSFNTLRFSRLHTHLICTKPKAFTPQKKTKHLYLNIDYSPFVLHLNTSVECL